MKKVTFTVEVYSYGEIKREPWTGYTTETPGLVVARVLLEDPAHRGKSVPGKRWTVNHLSSGYTFGPTFASRQAAIAFANRLDALDWTVDKDVILEDHYSDYVACVYPVVV